MSERLEEAVRLSRIAAELEANVRREPDVWTSPGSVDTGLLGGLGR